MAIDLTPSLATRLAYQNSQMADGTYTQAGSQVFKHLVTPPASGVAAEVASDVHAKATGFVPSVAGLASNEVEVITINGAPDGGTIPLRWGSGVGSVPFNASNAAVQTVLRGFTGLGPSNVTVAGSNGGPFTVTFGGALAGKTVPPIVSNGASLTKGGKSLPTLTVGVTVTTAGGPAFVNDAALDTTRQRDGMRNIADSASGNHV